MTISRQFCFFVVVLCSLGGKYTSHNSKDYMHKHNICSMLPGWPCVAAIGHNHPPPLDVLSNGEKILPQYCSKFYPNYLKFLQIDLTPQSLLIDGSHRQDSFPKPLSFPTLPLSRTASRHLSATQPTHDESSPPLCFPF